MKGFTTAGVHVLDEAWAEFQQQTFLFNTEFNDSTLSKQYIDVSRFSKSACGHVIEQHVVKSL